MLQAFAFYKRLHVDLQIFDIMNCIRNIISSFDGFIAIWIDEK